MTNKAETTENEMPSEAEGFAFLNGKWQVYNKKLKEPLTGRVEWTEFNTAASFFSLLDGLVSVEELRDAEGAPFGSAMRTFDRKRRIWLDAWVSASNGVLQAPVEGCFEGDVGTFIAQETYQGKAILVRCVWQRVSENEATWEQAASVDDGNTWELNWHMRFERIGEKVAIR